MNMKYSLFSMPDSEMEIEEFKSYLLEKDTLIIPDHGETICSTSLESKIHTDIPTLQKSYFYTYGWKTYFIFSQYYDKVGEVKVLFDTTPYIRSQLIIIKISFLAILFFSLLNYFLWKYVSQRAFSSLKKITDEVQHIDLQETKKITVPKGPKNDEIVILSVWINQAIQRVHHQANNLKQFITDVSHEFKTPLMSMNSYIDVFLKKTEKWIAQKEDAYRVCMSVKDDIKKLNKLLETLFFVTKIEEWILHLQTTPVHAKVFFEEKIQSLTHIFPSTYVSFEMVSTDELTFQVQEDLLSIVVENLLTNAVKFSKPHWKIKITLSKTWFEIQDFGDGIEPWELEKIWEKFYKKDIRKEGFWVGLFLVKRICEICHWNIQVTSKKDKGTKFSITF